MMQLSIILPVEKSVWGFFQKSKCVNEDSVYGELI